MSKYLFTFALLIFAAGAIVAAANFNSKVVSVPLNGTSVPLSDGNAPVFSSHLIIQADPANTNNMYLGGSDVNASLGVILAPGDIVNLGDLMRKHSNEAIDLRQVFLDSDTNDNSVRLGFFSNRYHGGQPTNQ